MRHFARIITLALLVSACSAIVGDTPTETGKPGSGDMPQATSTTTRDCVRHTPGTNPVDTGSVAGDALVLSGEVFVCADDVVVADPSDLNGVAAGAQLASALEGPLLLPHPQLAAELGRLKPARIYVFGSPDLITPPDAEVIRPTVSEAVDMAATALGVSEQVRLPSTPDATTVIATIEAIDQSDHVVLPQTAPANSGTVATQPDIDPAALVAGLVRQSEASSVWLVDANQPVALLAAAAIGRASGTTVVAYDPGDIFGYPEVGDALSGHDPGSIRFLGHVPGASEWELSVLAKGVQVPGGGFTILPQDRPRRYVAFYGHPETTGLGVLGEQGPQATLDRMAPYLEAYAGDGRQVIPTFEIIASVASAKPTEDDDYSFEWPPSSFAEWISTAAENDAYVVLDLQPGREDFLTQAKQYEELLKLPYVGLALDPEWRLKPDQVHLKQTGQVQASEINTVVEWLADLVRDNALPQKLLLVQQFQTRMIVDRDTIEQRPELQMIIQMDGQGPIPTKDDTYAALTAGEENAFWQWGWKNFFDEDSPKTATPEYTMSKVPVPVFVSYQ
ncbi:MAG: hypothetical protein WAN34_04595 [Acidimicrobiia bacterium]